MSKKKKKNKEVDTKNGTEEKPLFCEQLKAGDYDTTALIDKESRDNFLTMKPEFIPLNKDEKPQVPPIPEQPQPTGEGIVIIALGHPEYGKMAANLAASIRFADPFVKIHLVYTPSSITHIQAAHKALFTSMAECPAECYTKNGRSVYLKAKTHIYDLSPFEKTIMLDADMLFLSDESKKGAWQLFQDLKDVEFTFQNRGFLDLSAETLDPTFSRWANVNEVKAVYQTTGKFYHLASEFIYFTRTDSNKEFFDLAKKIFDEPKVKSFVFDNDIPDELAFDIAAAVLGKYPHKDNYVPIYWFATDKKKGLQDVRKTHYGLSIGGNVLPDDVLNKYLNEAKAHARRLGLPYHFKVFPKKQWSVGRKTA